MLTSYMEEMFSIILLGFGFVLYMSTHEFTHPHFNVKRRRRHQDLQSTPTHLNYVENRKNRNTKVNIIKTVHHELNRPVAKDNRFVRRR